VAVWHRADDGGAGEVAQVTGAMTRLKELAGQRELLLVGDSKLVSRGNIVAMNTARVACIAPAGKPTCPPSACASWTFKRPRRSTTLPNATKACRRAAGQLPGR
jgi:hypothetical protein